MASCIVQPWVAVQVPWVLVIFVTCSDTVCAHVKARQRGPACDSISSLAAPSGWPWVEANSLFVPWESPALHTKPARASPNPSKGTLQAGPGQVPSALLLFSLQNRARLYACMGPGKGGLS